jgi:hypothetical protein
VLWFVLSGTVTARSILMQHSSINDSCIHNGTIATVNRMPNAASPFNENASKTL